MMKRSRGLRVNPLKWVWCCAVFILAKSCLSHPLTDTASDQPIVAIPSDAEPGYPVKQYHYTGQIFRLLPSGFADHFAVAKDGLLMTTSGLSDLVKNGSSSGSLTVIEEHPEFSKIEVTEAVILDPEAMLRFRRPLFEGSVNENSAPGSMVTFDDDTCLAGRPSRRVKLTLTGPSTCQNDFALQSMYPSDGCFLVLSKRRFDAESDRTRYKCGVEAADASTGERVLAKLRIVVADLNDNAPVFLREFVNISLPFPVSSRQIIGRLNATDRDGDKVVYQQRQHSSNIVIVPQSGEIVIVDPPESVTDTFTAIADAMDKRPKPQPRLKADKPAIVFVSFFVPNESDEGSNAVEIERSFLVDKAEEIFRYRFKRQSSALRPTKKLEYKETDGAVEGQVVFQLDKESDREIFKIRDTSNVWVTVDPDGKVRVKKKWDYEELGPEKDINIWVEITNPNSQSGDVEYQRVIIEVKDVNDEPPFFINQPLPMKAVVQLNAAPNTPVYTLVARDPDTDSDIHYLLVRDRTGGRFEVDQRSGVVRTRGTDPFQLDMEYVLFVKAEDHNGRINDRQYQSTTEERLSIVGGKRPPQFYLQFYEADIPENQKKDSDIISVKAKSFADRDIRYTLKAKGQGAGTFNIGATSGIVKLAKELDFEDLRQPHLYSLTVTATEDSGGFSTSVELTIRVTDVNDNAPKFELPDYQAHGIDEDLPIGTSILQVKATDGDSGANAEIEYSVSKDEFSVDNKGVIRNNKRLDADNNNAYYEFQVTAKDKGEPPKTGSAMVRVYTKNKNDEEPKFSQQVYTPNVDENAGPKTLVNTVVASDKDGDNVEFGFVGGELESGQFVIEKKTGVIRLHSGKINLDQDKYELNVTATDDGSCCENGRQTLHTSTAVVVVFITDVNDNKPIFHECDTYNPKIQESSSNGSPVIKVEAVDKDKGMNGQVKYSIVQQPDKSGAKFTVDPDTGTIHTNKVFDREGEDGKFVSVTVKAVDQGEPSLEGVCSFTVEITDINDNSPLFDRQRYVENVKQDTSIGTNILRVSASDEDADNNGAILYTLHPAEEGSDDDQYFDIQPESGWISLKKPLHSSGRCTGWKRGRRTAGTRRCLAPSKSGIEDNPTVYYTLIKGGTAQTNKNDDFYLQQRSDVKFTWADIKVNKPLDYETIREYNLTIRVENNGAQQLASEATVHIKLEDVNDEIPLFTEREQKTVMEGEPPGTKVTTIRAIDRDGTSPNNLARKSKFVFKIHYGNRRVVTYAIVNSPRNEGKDYFDINPQTGEIFTKIVFDREKKQAYALEVEARDGAQSARPGMQNGPNTVTEYIRIGIADKNDNPPFFDKARYEAEVDENEDFQHTVLTVTAQDKDESSKIRYEITRGNVGGAFAVKKETGAIYVAGQLDYETRKRYELRLVATDNSNENHTTVVINIKDVNDNPPVFNWPVYEAQITEESNPDMPKEVVQYNLTLVASDSLNERSTQILISVKDVNDLPPVFGEKIYYTSMKEEQKTRQPIPLLQVQATDGDKDRPEDIVYFLTGQGVDPDNPENNKFAINRTTGAIYVLRELDRDYPNGRPQWRFTVFAQDEGGEGLVGFADVQINLRDINDNAPFFADGIYYGNVTENGTEDMPVMAMTATDYDDPNEGGNAKLTYSIDKNVIDDEKTGKPIFKIHPETGLITTNVCCLDREKTPEYSIQVVAEDGAGLKGTGTASIRVKDVNDMPPKFSKDEWHTEVDETEGTILPDVPILTVTVLDEDETNKFHYKVIGKQGYGADKFTMVRNSDGTGSLKVVQPLDYEDSRQQNGFRFRIQVNDRGDDSNVDNYHVAYSWVNVKLRDINDNKPVFEDANMEQLVPENAEVGKSLRTFKATDPDQGGRSKVSYAIDRSSDRRRQFSINDDGTVTIQRALDREETPRHQVKILAIDDGDPPKTATATLTVIVQDINDNAPKFLKNYRPVIPENSSPRKVVDILATDDDDRSKSNGPPFFFRMDPNADDQIKASFRVDHDPKGANGDGQATVHCQKSFDREEQKEYYVPIIITDAGNPAQSGTSTLTVIIGDENDNKMLPGSKEIFVYNYMGQNPETEIGRVYVFDLDDWDLPDKRFYWAEEEHQMFKLDNATGMITMKQGARQGTYDLKFVVYDRLHTQTNIQANVTVRVKDISEETVMNSGSIRIHGISDEDFIPMDSSAVLLNGLVMQSRRKIEEEVGINITMVNIDECLYENVACEGSCTNHLVVKTQPYMVNANKTALVGVRTEVVPECTCAARNFSMPSSCHPNPCMNGGRCIEDDYGTITCRCREGYDGPRCQMTSRSFHGQGYAWFPPLKMCSESHLSVEFLTESRDGLIFYNGPVSAPDPDEVIVSDYIALELVGGHPRLLIDFGSGTTELTIATTHGLDDGYWHRIDIFWDSEVVRMVVDYCKTLHVEELENGSKPMLDSKTCEKKGTIPPFNEYLNLNAPLQVGGVYHDPLDPVMFGWMYVPHGKLFKGCIRNFVHNSEILDLKNPGLVFKSYAGCPLIQDRCRGNDLEPRCGPNGVCDGSLFETKCKCKPGWKGATCQYPTVPATFEPQSCVKYALSFEPELFTTDIQLRFRTRERSGEMFRIRNGKLRFRYNLKSMETEEKTLVLTGVDVDDGQWHVAKVNRYGSAAILQLDGGEGINYNETFEFTGHQLLSVAKQEGVFAGGRAEYTGMRTFEVYADYQKGCLDDIRFEGHQLPLPPAKNGTHGGQATLFRNLREGCPSNKPCESIRCDEPFECFDLWMDYKCECPKGKEKGLDERTCVDKDECLLDPCLNGGTCRNIEDGFECLCRDGYTGLTCGSLVEGQVLRLSTSALAAILRVTQNTGRICEDLDECLNSPCQNEGTCENVSGKQHYICHCLPGYMGKDCDLERVTQNTGRICEDLDECLNSPCQNEGTCENVSGKQHYICHCLPVLVLVFVVYNRRREAAIKYPGPDDDVRENIINYDDEGGGEDDMTAFDITPLQIPVDGAPGVKPGLQGPITTPRPMYAGGPHPDVGLFIHDLKSKADNDPNAPPYDDLRNYAYEGGGSTAGSLSSLASGLFSFSLAGSIA
ncbi:unnamed protein product, partial [Notodromas monacha]